MTSYISIKSKIDEKGIINIRELNISSARGVISVSTTSVDAASGDPRIPDWFIKRHCSSSGISIRGLPASGSFVLEGEMSGIALEDGFLLERAIA